MTKKIKHIICRCPACGRHAGIIEYTQRVFRVGCFNSEKCGVKGPRRKSVHGAVTSWNRMIDDPREV